MEMGRPGCEMDSKRRFLRRSSGLYVLVATALIPLSVGGCGVQPSPEVKVMVQRGRLGALPAVMFHVTLRNISKRALKPRGAFRFRAPGSSLDVMDVPAPDGSGCISLEIAPATGRFCPPAPIRAACHGSAHGTAGQRHSVMVTCAKLRAGHSEQFWIPVNYPSTFDIKSIHGTVTVRSTESGGGQVFGEKDF